MQELETDALDALLMERLDEFGITRLADLTGLDRLGICTHSCVKPGTCDVISVYSGKGLTPSRSRVGAILECVERTCALWDDAAVLRCSERSLPSGERVWGPERFTERHVDVDEATLVDWASAETWPSRERVWVPAELVFGGRRAPNVMLARTSNGLAAGTSFEGALSRALAELIERDAVSCVEVRASHFGAMYLAGLARLLGSEASFLAQDYQDDIDLAPTIELESVPASVAKLVAAFQSAGISVVAKQIPNDCGVPVFGVAACEELGFDEVLAAAGYGASLDPEHALRSAFLELAQSRATDRQGAREDTDDVEKARHTRVPTAHWLATKGRNSVRFDQLSWRERRSAIDAEEYLQRLAWAGLNEIAIFRFPAPSGIHVVRVLVPGIETWHATAGASTFGPRLRAAIQAP